MADPRDDNMDDAMMDIINDGNEVQYDGADENPDGIDDGSQYLNPDLYEEEENIMQDNASEVYIQSLMYIYMELKMISFFV
jgi:hypothetical protein